MPSHPKGWGESWFYCKETSPAGENKLQGYRPSRLPVNFKLPDKLTEEEESEFVPVLYELRSLTNNGLTGVDLIRCWVEWRILPLSRREGLMCEFDGTLDHPQCYFHTALTEKDIVAIIKKLTGEPTTKCGQIGLKPFCKINPAPKKGDKFWSRRPKKQAMKSAKPPSKKNKGKGKSAAAEPSEVDESQAGDALSEAVKAVIGAKEPITSIKKVLGYLSTLPPQIGELTRSAARKGVLTALSRCLAYAPEINLEEVAAGFPQLKDDGSDFVEEDYHKVVKDSRLAATQLAASLDLTKYQAAYDDKNKKISPPTFVVTNLIPR
ncbi:hypothetical protein ZWY2020_043592 [Hordeum vulgare]|nr:hypothetical protein ZWY2020_043592 [Hordeum vulgare]